MQGHAKVCKNNSTSRNIQTMPEMYHPCISTSHISCKPCSHHRHDIGKLQFTDIPAKFHNLPAICYSLRLIRVCPVFWEFHCKSSTIGFNGVLTATFPSLRLHPYSYFCTSLSAAVPSRPVHSLRPLALLPHFLPKIFLVVVLEACDVLLLDLSLISTCESYSESCASIA